MSVLLYLACVILCQLAGDWLVSASGLPVPGPVVGLVLLFLALVVRGGVPSALDRVASPLLRHMSLFFIPAGTGVLLHLQLIAEEWLPIVAVIVVTTPLTLVVTALTLKVLSPPESSDPLAPRPKADAITETTP